jgi:hypothetical protein
MRAIDTWVDRLPSLGYMIFLIYRTWTIIFRVRFYIPLGSICTYLF